MANLFLFLSMLSFQVQAGTLNSNLVSLNMQNATLFEVLESIESQTQVGFLYNESEINVTGKISVDVTRKPLEQLLKEVLPPMGVDFQIEDQIIVLMPKLEDAITVEEFNDVTPTIDIKGRVTDSKGAPLPGATVLEKGTQNGIITDLDGNFKLSVSNEASVILVSYIGFETAEIEVGNKVTINVVLKTSASSLDEVVVVGYGTTNKRDLTGTVSTVKSEDIEEIKSVTIDQALVGKMSGVYVQNRGGKPGAGAFVHIRGLSQIRGDNQPLYVIDGVPITVTPNSESLGLINYGNRENPLLAINPNDIERVDVLKDASAAAIYGSRAANGVIIVTTKKGKQGQKPTFSFNVSTTIQNPVSKYEYVSTDEWKSYLQGQALSYLEGLGYPESYWPIYFAEPYNIAFNPDSYFGDADTDWQDLITNKNAMWKQYSFNVSGGTESVNYMVSVGVNDQDGVIIENNFKRYNFATNLDAQITKYLKVGTSLTYNYSINKNKGFNSLSQGAFRPDLTAYNEDGSYTLYDGPYGEEYTLLGLSMGRRTTAKSQNLIGSVFGELKFTKDLKFISRVSVGVNTDKTENFSSEMNNLFYAKYYSKPGASLGVQTNNGWSTSFQNTLNFNKTINKDHRIDAMIGVSWDRQRYDAESQSYRSFPDDDILTNINSATYFDGAESEHLEQGLNSIFGRINYVYKDKYLATFTARRDGSTKFGPENQFGFFPSGALAWNIHNEEFFKSVDFIDMLKARVTIGKVGSDNLPSFTYLAYYQSLENNDSFYDGKNGIAVTGVPNKTIRWEETNQLDIGLEFGLFNSRITGEIVYFEKNTNGIILFDPIPYQTGSRSWNANIGDVTNKGWEIVIGGDIFRKTDFTWNTSFNISFVRNKVTNLYSGNVGYQGGIREGYPIGVIIGYDVIKIAQTQEEIDALNAEAGGTYQSTLTQPGDYIFRDINDDGIINVDDRGPIGDINPDYYGGWNNHITYKNWDLTMNWSYAQGVEREYEPITNLYYVDFNSNFTNIVNETWTPERTDAKYARHGSGTNGYTATSRSVVDASYIKLRSMSIGYNLPKRLYSKLGISNAKLTISGNNLITITKYPGLDPEDVSAFSFAGRTTGFTSDDGRSYPNVRTFTVSLNVTF